MAQFDADIALRVQVLDSEIKELESRINKINNTKITVNPYLPSGARRADAITRSEADRLKIQQAGLQIDKNRLQLEQSIRTEQLKSLNTRSSWVRFLEKGAQLQRDIAQNSAREAANAAKAASARRGQRLESLALGAGFPLLFGGGPGAVIGGVAGSFLGKGFGGQIILSAIGQQFDKLFEEIGKTGVALTSTSGAFDLMNEKSLFSSDAARELAAQLEEQGKAQELAALLSEELSNQLGARGVQALQSAGKETEEFTRLVNLLFTQLSAFVSGPLASFLALINQGLGALTTNITYGSIRDQLEGEAKKRFQELERQERGVTRKNVRGGGTQEVLGSLTTAGQKNILDQLKKEGLIPTAPIPVTSQDLRTIKAPKAGSGNAEANREARTQRRLAELAQETQFIRDQEAIKQRIFAAEQAKDPLLVKRLEGEQKIAEIMQRGAEAVTRETDARVIAAVQAKTVAQVEAQRKDNARDLEEIQNRINESYTDAIRDLEFQLELEKAVTREEENQIKLRQKAASLEGKGYSSEQIEGILAATKAVQDAQAPLQQYITQTQKWLNDTEAMIVSLAQSVQTSISGAMAGAVEALVTGSKTVQEVLSEMFAQIGRAFINMAAEIIAKQLVMIALQGILKALGGASGGTETNSQFMERTGNLDLVGDSYKNLPKFAEGGYVTGPTNAIVGEGGQSEYVIPSSKMNGAMARWNAGVRGKTVIDGPGGASGAGVASNNAVPTFRLETTVINGVEYATVDQVRAMGATASKNGAAMGEARTMRKLQMSPGARRKVGLR